MAEDAASGSCTGLSARLVVVEDDAASCRRGVLAGNHLEAQAAILHDQSPIGCMRKQVEEAALVESKPKVRKDRAQLELELEPELQDDTAGLQPTIRAPGLKITQREDLSPVESKLKLREDEMRLEPRPLEAR